MSVEIPLRKASHKIVHSFFIREVEMNITNHCDRSVRDFGSVKGIYETGIH
jgi:hypothetical protein